MTMLLQKWKQIGVIEINLNVTLHKQQPYLSFPAALSRSRTLCVRSPVSCKRVHLTLFSASGPTTPESLMCSTASTCPHSSSTWGFWRWSA